MEGIGLDASILKEALDVVPKPTPKTKVDEPEVENAEESSSQPQDASNGRKKRAPRKKDPDAPKRPLPAYLQWSNEERKVVRDELSKEGKPVLGRTEMNEELRKRWDALPEADRKKIEAKGEDEKRKYHEEVTAYNQTKAKATEASEASQAAEPADVEPPSEAAESTSGTKHKKRSKEHTSGDTEKKKKKKRQSISSSP